MAIIIIILIIIINITPSSENGSVQKSTIKESTRHKWVKVIDLIIHASVSVRVIIFHALQNEATPKMPQSRSEPSLGMERRQMGNKQG